MNRQNENMVETAKRWLQEQINLVKQPELQTFLSGVVKEFEDHPGGSTHHHGYRYGLLIHTAEVTELAVIMAMTMRNADEKVVRVAAIMHDWGKIHDYEFKDDYTYEVVRDTSGFEIGSRSRVSGKHVVKRPGYQKAAHIIASYDKWNSIYDTDYNDVSRKWVTDNNDFITKVGRCILSHHGQLEWGSVLTPSTPEEWCLHLADMASASAGVVL